MNGRGAKSGNSAPALKWKAQCRSGRTDVHRSPGGTGQRMTHIHASAIIDCNAQLDSTVVIGPYAVIGAHVRIGAHTTVGAHSVIDGHTTIGSSNRIGHFAALGGLPQDMKYQGEETRLEIGDRNTIREFTSIHTGTAQGAGLTRVGHDNWIMAYVHIAHDCLIGSHTVLANNAQIAGHVQVHDWA